MLTKEVSSNDAVRENLKKILVIDDELGMRDLLNQELSRYGYFVSAVSHGKEGIEALKRERFDLVLCDILMPHLNGLETLEAIKKNSPDVEVIMMTGHATIENALAAMKKGAYDFLQKPFNLDEVKILIEKAFEKSELKTLIGVYEVSKAVFKSFKKEEFLPQIIKLVIKVLNVDDVSIFLKGEDGRLEVGATSIAGDPSKQQLSLEEGKNRLSGISPQEREPRLVSKSQIVYPLVLNGEILGLLMVRRSSDKAPFTSSDLRSATIFSSHVAQSVYNAKIYQELEEKIRQLKMTNQKLKETKSQLIQSEKLAAIGQLAAGVAHELNNPLTGILGLSQMILGEVSFKEEQREDMETIIKESKRCRLIIQNLLKFSRRNEPKRESVNVISLLDSIIEMVHYEFTSSSIDILKEYSPPLAPVFGDPAQLQQVFINIITNAKHAMEGESAARLTIQAHQKSNRVYLRFKDNGCGIPKEAVTKIFDPFFTTKPVGLGTGLGLSISYGIIQEHGGTIFVESKAGIGTIFTVELPSHQSGDTRE